MGIGCEIIDGKGQGANMGLEVLSVPFVEMSVMISGNREGG